MITLPKLSEYAEYHGFFDGWYIQRIKSGTNLNSEADWALIVSLIQDIQVVNRKLASTDFSNNLIERLKENCDSEEAINQLMVLANQEW